MVYIYCLIAFVLGSVLGVALTAILSIAGAEDEKMTLYTIGQMVTYKNRKWIIEGFREDENGNTVYLIKRGVYTAEADETEVS